jgi:hypothetical protein
VHAETSDRHAQPFDWLPATLRRAQGKLARDRQDKLREESRHIWGQIFILDKWLLIFLFVLMQLIICQE